MPMGAVPSFAGYQIFGAAYKFRGSVLPRATQRAAIAGVNGVAHLDLGFRGFQTQVTGVLYGFPAGGTDPASLNYKIHQWNSFRDGLMYSLVDNAGITWPYVTLEDFRYDDPLGPDQRWGFWCRYSASFFHAAYPS